MAQASQFRFLLEPIANRRSADRVRLEGRVRIPSPYLGGRGGFEAAVPLVASGRRAQTGQSRKAFSYGGPKFESVSLQKGGRRNFRGPISRRDI
jgi:hypothetical protein